MKKTMHDGIEVCTYEFEDATNLDKKGPHICPPIPENCAHEILYNHCTKCGMKMRDIGAYD
jgi:hypothetical protein